ncbi:hypothetical protein [Mesorhizobium sp. M2A.F.Ca.ET.039.01.1.1]|uniref:hypothetical protein n=1 Tax=Mesorhizobium sp. M2A.F.Ca.ET.039.01.1.1 TaxID=2496746 RepID=UPI000FCC5279|nr:hypothetical protein [Mesorhizobium sp. M2A.F.Ca.ET.039.01.1.1]RWX72512.1 hypothetical protein EOA24_00535 [Mesorhizobium sp. M2A.F.Ca.ET.039.01.1.1]
MRDLFDALHKPPVIVPVDRDGPVVQGEADVSFVLPHKRLAWHQAEIELHRHDNGLWMWSASFNCGGHGSSYKVGAKWGKFAESKDDALFYAVQEIERRLEKSDGPEATAILKWARGLVV